MSLDRYGVLKGRVLDHRREPDDDTPHYQILIDGDGSARAAVNVLSSGQESDPKMSELLYVAVEDFQHPILADLEKLKDGYKELDRKPGGLALDYIRGSLFDRTDLRALPAHEPGEDNDLADVLDHYVTRAQANNGSRIYAFGEPWSAEKEADKVFRFRPGRGIHNIHMNQGSAGRFKGDNGVWQDGALLFHFPAADRWVAIFLAFQSQRWHTDDRTGGALPDVPQARPGGQPAEGEPDQRLRIVGALVNAVGPSPEDESVTLINTTTESVDLAGWAIADRDQHQVSLPARTLAAGETIRIPLVPPVALGNHGGTITLLDAVGLKVDGVAYTAADATEEGRTVVF
ncbi:DUF2278 family protein [Parafrankia sp. EUN1f]|uniref:DUF2278 family protein n=1 Tax=Parafrankia sp. EUN1f TaxID=102897 RepID=UPI0001C43DBD|nr:DUF2278 family protein [Parafrankia sp. EUN1f]EFC85944.1 conserved hypothetical protein [Parafrankia sp. EUN1f]